MQSVRRPMNDAVSVVTRLAPAQSGSLPATLAKGRVKFVSLFLSLDTGGPASLIDADARGRLNSRSTEGPRAKARPQSYAPTPMCSDVEVSGCLEELARYGSELGDADVRCLHEESATGSRE